MFTRYEIALICNIAATYEKEDINTSISILKQLSEYFKNIKVDDEERSLSEVFVLLNLARLLGIQGNSLEAKEIESMLLDICIKGCKGSNLASILYNLAYEEEILGMDVSISQKHLLQAYYAACLCNNDDMKKHILMHIEEKYSIDLRKNQVDIHPKSSSPLLS